MDATIEPASADASSIAGAVRAGELASDAPALAAVQAAHRRASLNAFIEVRPPTEEMHARSGSLAGVPVAVKDVFADGERAPTAGSRVAARGLRGQTALVLRRLRAAGAVVVGYTNLHEWGVAMTSTVSAFGPVRNPWDEARIAGGSSGGSAAALAAGIVPLALGGDAGGSIRCPAACCGVVGLKPTRGLVPASGYTGEGCRFDHVGPMARNVADAHVMLEVLAGGRIDVPDVRGIRVGVPRAPFVDDAAPYVGAALDDVVARLARVVDVVEISLPVATDARRAVADVLVHTAALLSDDLADRPDDFDLETLDLLRNAAALTHERRGLIEAATARVTAAWDAALEAVDAVLTPTLPSIAPAASQPAVRLRGRPVDATRAFLEWTASHNVAGVPALSIPCAEHEGMPVGVTLAAARGRDGLVLALGRVVEDAFDRRFANRIAG